MDRPNARGLATILEALDALVAEAVSYDDFERAAALTRIRKRLTGLPVGTEPPEPSSS